MLFGLFFAECKTIDIEYTTILVLSVVAGDFASIFLPRVDV